MGDSEISEPMEDPQSEAGAQKIDMSLDEIIKLNKKEQKANRAADRARGRRVTNRNNVLRKLNQAPQIQGRGALQHRGPVRSRGRNRSPGLGRGSGLSPLKRPFSLTREQLDQNAVSLRGSYRGRGRGRGGLSRGPFSARGRRPSSSGGRPFVLDRGFAASRGKLERYQKIQSALESQRPESSSGTRVTVSLSNAQSAPATQVRRGGISARRGGRVLRGSSSETLSGISAPKGIPLYFNYKATSNQTQLSLNDRFTSLKIRGRGLNAYWESGRGQGLSRVQIRGGRGGRGRGVITGGGGRGRGRGRGVVTGRGRGRGMLAGEGRGRGRAAIRGGRGRARGRGGARGSGRSVFLQ